MVQLQQHSDVGINRCVFTVDWVKGIVTRGWCDSSVQLFQKLGWQMMEGLEKDLRDRKSGQTLMT